METKKAIEWLRAISATQKDSLHGNSLADRKEALYVAMYKLRKEIPNKPHIFTDHDRFDKNGCPKCYEDKGRNEILYAGQKYCSVRGQAIDWIRDDRGEK